MIRKGSIAFYFIKKYNLVTDMYRKRSLKTLFLFIILVIVIHCSFAVLYPGHAKTTAEDHSRWAAAIQKNGLPNFYKVSDTLYRGARPTQEGFMELKMCGQLFLLFFPDKLFRSFYTFRSNNDPITGNTI
ncbi:MAG: hypothetical protein C0399_00930 [Syntrophus sp. (in: bacteria)]|nr:hypothetical protein [Syntrophus sp. (in: bacteria)]